MGNKFRYFYIFLIVLFCCGSSAFAQNEIRYRIGQGYDRMFYNTNNPKIEIVAYNKDEYLGCNADIVCKVESFDGEPVYQFFQRFYAAPSDSATLGFSFSVAPGFYRVILEKEGEAIERAVMGYEPEKIIDKSFANSFVLENGSTVYASEIPLLWKVSVNVLADIPINADVHKVKKNGGKLRNAYKVTMRSVENAVIEGYYVTPKKSGVYPVAITCTDKNEELWIPDCNCNGERIDFVIAPRKTRVPNEAHYFNMCMDVVRAIDFVVHRKEADLKNIVLNGRGVGGALAIGAAALDNRVAAVSAYAPALSIESADGREKVYDIKYMSGELKCPLLMGVGLEDTMCPPHKNFEIYNRVESVKEYYIFVNDHSLPALWSELADNFYSKHRR